MALRILGNLLFIAITACSKPPSPPHVSYITPQGVASAGPSYLNVRGHERMRHLRKNHCLNSKGVMIVGCE